MTKKNLLLSVLLCSSLAMAAVDENGFTCNVKVGSSDGVSLVFGQAETDDVKPFPPFSGMFGVKDIYLANAKNFEAVTVEGDMARVSTDLRSGAQKWVIVANSNASLKFEMPGEKKTLFCSFTDPKKGETKKEIANGDTLSVKAGVSYTLALESYQPAVEPAQDKMNINAVATKDPATKAYIASKTIEGLVAEGTYSLNFVCDGSVGEWVRAEKDWMVSLGDATNVSWSGDKVTFKVPASGKLEFSAAASTGSAAPLNATLLDAENKKAAAINAVLQKLGTLDFDQNGKVNSNDATFFYNYVSIGGADFADEITPYADSTITDDLEADAQRALDFFKSMNGSLSELSLVERDIIGEDIVKLGDSSTFFYNYEAIGGADFPDEITPYTSRKDNTEQDMKDAQEALDRIREMHE